MQFGEKVVRPAGIAILIFAVLVIADVVLETAIVGESNAIARGDVEPMLADIDDNLNLFYASAGLGVLGDGVGLLVLATVLWSLLRDRSPVLSQVGFGGLLLGGGLFLVADVAALVTGVLASDYVESGGAGGIAAGDTATLQAARATAAVWALADIVGMVALGAGILSFASTLAWAPEGQVNPPRWLGILGVASSFTMMWIWTFVFQEDLGWTIGGIGIVGSLAFLVILGGWLVSRPAVGSNPSISNPLPRGA